MEAEDAMGSLTRQGSAMLANFLSLVSTEAPNLAESQFCGTWQVEDTEGNSFAITLFPSGTAEADRDGEGMSGNWNEEDQSAVIEWDTGWTTKITKTGEGFVKTAYDRTASIPTNTSEAVKVA
jgi:hypothetical protein